ncbi:MAG: iron-sulfur cluster loop [Desulfurococcaceae archaeon]
MDVIGIDKSVVEKAARVIKNKVNELPKLDVYDERFYPSKSEEPENTLRYFIVMVAIDHRLSRPSKRYYACLDDGCYKGADLLYRLGIKKFNENPNFFSPENLSKVTVKEVTDAFTVGDATPPDPDIRTALLRDLGLKLVKLYSSSVTRLLECSNDRLRGSLEKPGLADNLRVFRAYEDPVEKKTMLLAKFLIARGLYNPVDQLDVAVDNHLSRIAYRLGLVMVSGPIWDKIRNGIDVTSEEDFILRLVIRRAYRQVAEKAGLSPVTIDDYFWIMGRTICLRDEPPHCEKCLFKGFCRARVNAAFMVKEHAFPYTWYY